MGSKLQRLQVSGGTSHSTWGRHTTAWRGRGGGWRGPGQQLCLWACEALHSVHLRAGCRKEPTISVKDCVRPPQAVEPSRVLLLVVLARRVLPFQIILWLHQRRWTRRWRYPVLHSYLLTSLSLRLLRNTCLLVLPVVELLRGSHFNEMTGTDTSTELSIVGSLHFSGYF